MSLPSAVESPDLPKSESKLSQSRRKKIRNGSFIHPSTGERIRRQITLCDSPNLEPSIINGVPIGNTSIYDATPPLAPSQRSNSRLRYLQVIDQFLIKLHVLIKWLKTSTGKGVMKCSLAYLVGSMGTFLPPLSNFLGHQDGKHILATVMVYFHPARSAGSMAEAAMLGFIAILYATFVGFSSMAVSVIFGTHLDMVEVAYGLILIFFCGGGLGLVGWFKQSHNSPLVSVACSLASLAIITILTKEVAIQIGVFSLDKIVQVLKMVATGITLSAVLSLLLWPISARKELRETMAQVTRSASDMLSLITKSFLTGSEKQMRTSLFTAAQKDHKLLFIQLSKCLREAKFEHYILGTEALYRHESNLVNCLERLAQSIGGLRSAAMTQFTLLNESSGLGNSTPTNLPRYVPEFYEDSLLATLAKKNDDSEALKSIDEVLNGESSTEDFQSDSSSIKPKFMRSNSGFSVNSSLILPSVRTPSEIFSRFILLLGPSIKSLAYTLAQILQDFPINEEPEIAIIKIEQFKKSLGGALKLYSSTRSLALKELYKGKELDRQRPQSIEADFEEVAASCGYFSFSLQTFAKEMLNFMEILEIFKEENEKSRRSWNWICFWRKSRKSSPINEEEESLVPKISQTHIPRNPNLVLKSPEKRKRSMTRNVPNIKERLAYRLISLMKFLNRDEIRFSIKVGIGASLYALFAYIPTTRPFYQHWRGEWGLLSYMLVCSMTIGASNTTGYSRFIGTFIGACIAIFVWILCQGNAIGLAFCGWLISLPCFYLIVAKNKAPFGRFIMLTYNLSCLYAYSLSIKEGDDDDDEGGIAPIISEIALHRLIAVFTGVIWGLIITRIIWPVSARRKLQDGLSLLWLRMGLIWKRDPLATLLEGDSLVPYMDLREEFALQRYLLRLESMRNSAINEFELRGPFPTKEFQHIMDSTSKMLDSFHAMNVVIQTDLVVSEGEKILLQYTADERAHLCLIISQLYQVLASSLKLEYPVNDPLPSISKARDLLLSKIFQFRKNSAYSDFENHRAILKDEDYELLYAYILVTGQLAEEICHVESEIIQLYGVLGEDSLRLK